ncbi:MAG: hypothetical protein ABSC56_02335 [Solirubrobacteraceae bacterium]|jgi:hypothetical protein
MSSQRAVGLTAVDITADYYVTDGEGLYRTLGPTADIADRLICLEDCITLEVVLVPIATVLALEPVAPAAVAA